MDWVEIEGSNLNAKAQRAQRAQREKRNGSVFRGARDLLIFMNSSVGALASDCAEGSHMYFFATFAFFAVLR